MIQILILSHKNLAKEILESTEMIMGKQTNVTALGLSTDHSFDTFFEEVAENIDRMPKDDEILILTDVFGGSPCNIAALFCTRNANNGSKPRFACVSGVNLPMLMEALVSRDNMDIESLQKHCIEHGCKGIKNVLEAMK